MKSSKRLVVVCAALILPCIARAQQPASLSTVAAQVARQQSSTVNTPERNGIAPEQVAAVVALIHQAQTDPKARLSSSYHYANAEFESEGWRYLLQYSGDAHSGRLIISVCPSDWKDVDRDQLVVDDKDLDGRVDMGVDRRFHIHADPKFFYRFSDRKVQGSRHYSYWQAFFAKAIAAALSATEVVPSSR